MVILPLNLLDGAGKSYPEAVVAKEERKEMAKQKLVQRDVVGQMERERRS